MSSGSAASVTVSNAVAERAQAQSPPQLQKEFEEKSEEVSQSTKDTLDAAVRGDADRELDSKDQTSAVNGNPAANGEQKEKEEGHAITNDKQKEKEREKDKEDSSSSREDKGYAPNVFYTYARRIDTDKPNNHLYLLTFTSASALPLFLSAVRSEFPDSQISRDAPQLLTFKGCGILEKAWKADKQNDLKDLKRKWFYHPLADHATKPQPILPFQDEKGWLVGPQIAAGGGVDEPTTFPPWPSFFPQIPSAKGKEKKIVDFADQLAPSSSAALPKLTNHLESIGAMLETSASQIRALESAQETTHDTLTSALESCVRQIQQLTQGQQKLVEACEELRKVMKEREELWQEAGAGGLGWRSNASPVSCGHEVHKPPRKVGRKVVGYVYGEMEGDGVGEKEK